MQDITIKITGKHFVGEEQEEEIQFISDGKMYHRGDACYYIYDESDFSGMPGLTTSLKLTENTLRMKRFGGGEVYGGELLFEKGKRFISRYRTPEGSLDVEVLTHDVKRELTPEGFGKITLHYDISFEGLAEERNELDIEILQ